MICLKELLVIVPVFNEEKNLANLLESLSEPKIRSFADILIINDASSDRTGAIAKSKYAFIAHNLT